MAQLAGKIAGAKQKRPSPDGLAPDPDELTRRLRVVIAERKALSERKRRVQTQSVKKPSTLSTTNKGLSLDTGHTSTQQMLQHRRAKSEQGLGKDNLARVISTTSTDSDGHELENGTYRHIPKVAAAQFTRTTTVETLSERSLMRKLSRKAIRSHVDGRSDNLDIVASRHDIATLGDQATALRRSRSQRNHIQYANPLDKGIEAEEWQAQKSNRHTFDGREMANRHSFLEEIAAHRLSTGSNTARAELNLGSHDLPGIFEATQEAEDREVDVNEHRVDWTQSDEMDRRDRQPDLLTLRKSESIWTLRGKLGLHKGSRKSPVDLGAGMPKSPKERFLAHFKR